jgi:hypothetical protein
MDEANPAEQLAAELAVLSASELVNSVVEWLRTPEGEDWSRQRIKEACKAPDGVFNNYSAATCQEFHARTYNQSVALGFFDIRSG